MAERIRRHDWASTALGPVAGWPPHLRTAVDIALASPTPTSILWGEQRLQLYNDAYRAIARDRHPAILGRPVLENWPEANELIGPMLNRVFASGEPSQAENWPVWLDDADGVPVERLFTFTFSAIRDRYGRIAGVLHTAIETTAQWHAERQLRERTSATELSADFRALFQAAPAPLLLLAPPDLRIVAANDALLRASGDALEHLLDRPVAEAFEHASMPFVADGQLRASLDRVLALRAPDTLPPATRAGAPAGAGRRWWTVTSTPVLDPWGTVALVLLRAEDVTEQMRPRGAAEARHPPAPAVGAPAQPVLARLLDAIPDGVHAFDRDLRLAYANHAMRELSATAASDPLGRTFAELGYPPDLAQRLDGHLRHVLDTGETVEDEISFEDPTGARAYVQFAWGPLRGADGGIEQVVGVSRDTSERRRMEERLRHGEARQSFLLQLGDRLRGLGDATRIIAAACAMVGRHLGVGRCGYGEVADGGEHFQVERDWTDGAMPSLAGRTPLADFGAGVVAQCRAGQIVVIDDPRADARTRGAEQGYARAGPIRAGVVAPLVKGGRFVAAFYVHQTRPRHWLDEEAALVGEVAERTWSAVARARAERALRASERRYRALFDAIDEGFCLVEKVDTAPGQPSDYRYLATNPAFMAHTGIAGAVGHTMRELLPGTASFWCDTFDGIVARGDATRFEHGILSHGQVFDVYACRLDDGSHRRVAVIFDDITERKRHEQHQRLLLNELNHRVKNTLVTVQSMAMQSFRAGDDPEQARGRFEGRLMALSRAHDILTREHWSGAPLAVVVREAIAPWRDQRHGRLRTDGPLVWLPPRHALAFAMVLHELGTNAVKYGALSAPDGEVAISWTVAEALRLRWVESGGPPVVAPTRRGFGSRLIEHGLHHEIGGRVTLDFAPGGVSCAIEAPLDDAGPAAGLE